MKTLPMAAFCLTVSAQAWAQDTAINQINLNIFSQQSYTEGTTANVSIPIVQGCPNADKTEYSDTTDVIVVFPNAESVHQGANAMMAIRPRVTQTFGLVGQKRGSVPVYYNRGEQSEDVRAIHWAHGYIPGNMYETLEFKASFPKLEGCVKNIKISTAVIQYCESGDKRVRIKNPTTRFPENVISSDPAPSFEVVRDLRNNPMDTSCGQGETLSVSPSASDIDLFAVREIEFFPVEGDGGIGDGGDDFPLPPLGDSIDNDTWIPTLEDPDGTGENTAPTIITDETPIPVDGGDGTGAGAGPIPFFGRW